MAILTVRVHRFPCLCFLPQGHGALQTLADPREGGHQCRGAGVPAEAVWDPGGRHRHAGPNAERRWRGGGWGEARLGGGPTPAREMSVCIRG